MPASRPTSLLVLGLGNLLCRDDGLGVVVVDGLSRGYSAPSGVRFLDGGTLGLSLLPHLEDAEAAILVDAVATGAPPGTLVRLEGDEVGPAVSARLSPHQVGVADLLDAARWRLRLPGRLLLLGAVPETVGLGFGLSPALAAAVPEVTRQVVAAAAELGHVLPRRLQDEGPAILGPALLPDPLRL
jgi:hydrogenase maturation protease